MRLYLSSFRIGDHPEELLGLLGSGRRRIAVIANAVDAAPPKVRAAGVGLETEALAALGLEPTEVDLRDYVNRPAEVVDELASYDGWWIRGGNVFVLRVAIARTGAEQRLVELVEQDQVVYTGYSAGPCVLAPSLRGLELVDPVGDVATTYGVEPVWDGLGILDFAFVPHYRSAGHPETDDIERVAQLYRTQGTPHRTLSDGQAIVIDGATERLV